MSTMGPGDELLIRAAIVDELSAPLRSIDAQVKELTADLRRLSEQGAVPATAGINRLEAAKGKLAATAKDLHTRVLSLSDGLGNILVGGAKRALEVTGALAAGMTILGVKATANIESARLGIQTFVGDVTKGNSLFGQLRGLTGPFGLTDVTGAAQSLLVASDGADRLIPRMKALADIAATQADPKAALSSLAESINKIQESGMVDARVLRPMLAAGVPVYELLANELGIPVEQVKKTIAKGAPIDLPVRFLTDIETEAGPLAKFRGALDKQRQTLMGQFQGINLAVRGALGDVFSPLGDSMKAVTPALKGALVGLIQGAGPNLVSFLTAVTGLLGGLIPILSPIVSSTLGALGSVLTALVPALNQIAPQMPALATAFANLLLALIPLIPPLTTLTIALIPVLVQALGLLTGATTTAIRWVTPIIDTFAHWVDHSSALRTVLADLLIGILAYRAITTVVTTVVNMAKAIMAVRDAVIALQTAEGAGGMLKVLTGAAGPAEAAAGIGAVSAETGGLAASVTAAAGALSAAAIPIVAIAGAVGLWKADQQARTPEGQAFWQAQHSRDAALAADATSATARVAKGLPAVPMYGDAYGGARQPRTASSVTTDPKGAAAATADLARQGWRQDPNTGRLVTINGPLVHADNLHSGANVADAFTEALRRIEQDRTERGSGK